MRRAVNVLVFPVLGLLTLAVAVTPVRSAHAQTLDLDGVRSGPAIPAENAAIELFRVLEGEKRELDMQAARLAAEAKLGAEAKVKLRQIAMALLQQGAGRPWSQSAPVVFGLRLANIMTRLDRAIDAATQGKRVDGSALSPTDARAVSDALRKLTVTQLDGLRASMTSSTTTPAAITRALAESLGPVASVLQLTEGATLPDAWPVLATAGGSGNPARAEPTSARPMPTATDAASVAAAIERLDAGGAKDAARAVLSHATKDSIADDSLLRTITANCDALQWSTELRSGSRVPPIDASALAAVERRATSALERLAAALSAVPIDAAGVASVAAQADALAPSLEASRAMLAMREASWATDASRQALADACASLCAAELPSEAAERSRARLAERILEACTAADLLSRAEASEAPRDLKDVVRALDREARNSVRTLPGVFAEMTRDPSRAVDPAALSGVTRVTTLAADRTRLVELQGLIDRIGGVQPKAGRSFAAVAKRLARMLLDPIKRSDAQVAFAAIESQAASALPLPFEDELNRGSDRAEALTGGNSRRVLETAATMRVAWVESIGGGNFGGPASQRLDLVARYCAALRDVAQLSAPITREEGDRLASWGGWAARRALLAPAATDLDARAILASRSLIAMGANGDATAFTRDLVALEQDLPLVRLTARLERTLAPSLASDPTSTAAMLAAIVDAPAPTAALAREWDRLLTLNRALLEAEFARRTGQTAYRAALSEYISTLAGDIETSAFGTRPAVGAVPGFDGTATEDATGRQRRSTEKPRAR
ncbi:MAG: hypothetical protein RLY21_991 [Planctomycetota bacterium]|jgi:hypothetical protein